MITATGWTWEYIDEYMTLPRLNALTTHWKSHPPVHVLVAGILGFKPEDTQMPVDESGEQDFSALLSLGTEVNHG